MRKASARSPGVDANSSLTSHMTSWPLTIWGCCGCHLLYQEDGIKCLGKQVCHENNIRDTKYLEDTRHPIKSCPINQALHPAHLEMTVVSVPSLEAVCTPGQAPNQ